MSAGAMSMKALASAKMSRIGTRTEAGSVRGVPPSRPARVRRACSRLRNADAVGSVDIMVNDAGPVAAVPISGWSTSRARRDRCQAGEAAR